MGTPFTGIRFQAQNATGILPFAELETYAAGTLTPLATYTSESLAATNATTVVCDASGQADVWIGDAAYRFRLYTSTSSGRTLVYDRDNYKSIGAVTGEFLVPFRAELANDASTSQGTGMVGHGNNISYPSTSVGFVINSSAMRGNLLRHIPRAQWAAHLDYTSTHDDTTAMTNWMAEISNSKITGILPDGKFRYNGAGFSENFVRIKGGSRPRPNAALTALEGGSIIVGNTNFYGDLVDIENVGFDHGSANFGSGADALSITTLSDGLFCRIQNVVGLCRVPNEAFHAVLVSGYSNTDINDVAGIHSWYGTAVKLRKGSVRNIKGYYNGIAGLIVRSNLPDGVCEDIIVDGVLTIGSGNASVGSGGSDYGFYYVVDDQAQRVIASNIICKNVKNAVALRANSTINDVILNNIIVQDTEAGVSLISGPGQIFHTQITNVQALDVTAWALLAQECNSLSVNNFYGSAVSGSGYLDELIRIESGVSATMMDGIKLVSNRSETLGSIRYLNANSQNTVGQNMRCKYNGTGGTPEDPQSSTQTGSVTLQPIPVGNGKIYIQSTRGGVASAVVAIDREYSPGPTRFQRGTILIVKNNDASNLTINNSATNVVTKAGTNIVILPSSAAMFVFDGAIWAEV